MQKIAAYLIAAVVAVTFIISTGSSCKSTEVVRPEEIRSMRVICYDQKTYEELANLWEKYLKAYPSEYAYGNWVYAERYARRRDFIPLAKEGLKKYPSNPLLLYLASMEKNNARDNQEGRELLERAVRIDPNYLDPWFSLITVYMSANDDKKVDEALRRIVESGYIHDDIIDYNYNVLIGLEPNAILITNGDNDTYPSWILQRVMSVRPDVTIANMSLLNTDWYPEYLMAHGAPRFVTTAEIAEIRKRVEGELATSNEKSQVMNLFAKPMLTELIEQAKSDNRPVYFALTVYEDDFMNNYKEQGRLLGLATLVSPTTRPIKEQLTETTSAWTNKYRTGGLDGWRLRNTPFSDSGKRFVPNYAFVAVSTADQLKEHAPELRGQLFQWYVRHIDGLLDEEMRKQLCREWSHHSDVPEINEWCEQRGCRM